MKKPTLCLFLLLTAFVYCPAQTGALTLFACYQLAEQHYPAIKRYELIGKTREYTVANLQKGYLPQLSVYGQASYQSAVTEVPLSLPGIALPTISKDQYKAYAQVDQVLYDGGNIRLQKALTESEALSAQEQLAADLYQVRERVNQLFFGILMTDEQLKQNDLLVADLQLGLKKAQAAVDNGTAFRSNADLIRAEILSADQQATGWRTARSAYASMLSQFIGQEVGQSTVLVKPPEATAAAGIRRPELKAFAARVRNLDVQDRLLVSAALPRIGLFLQGGIGRPGLNMLNNDVQGYYIGGLRLSWSPSSFYTLKKKRAGIEVSRREIGVQQETFLFNTDLTIKQQNSEIGKYRELLATDEEIITLRISIKEAAMAQLENGVITGNDFLKEVHDEDRARQNKLLHELQLLMNQYNQQTTTGNQP